jgi:gas vesicle protein
LSVACPEDAFGFNLYDGLDDCYQEINIMAGKRTGAFIGGLLLGTAIGTAIGLLVAPRSGRETRRFLRKSAEALPEVAEDVSTNLQYQTERLLDSAQKSLDETLLRLQEAIATGKEAMVQKQRELKHQQLKAQTLSDLEQDHRPELEGKSRSGMPEVTPYSTRLSSGQEDR